MIGAVVIMAAFAGVCAVVAVGHILLSGRITALGRVLGDRIAGVDARIGSVVTRMDSVEQRMAALDDTVRSAGDRLTALENAHAPHAQEPEIR